MAGEHLSREEFFGKLAELFKTHIEKDHGSIFLSQKRLLHESERPNGSKPTNLDPDNLLPIIVRVSNGKSKKSKSQKTKLSTVVQPNDIEEFFAQYSDVCKAGMQGLRKRDRKAKKKDKSKKKKSAPIEA